MWYFYKPGHQLLQQGTQPRLLVAKAKHQVASWTTLEPSGCVPASRCTALQSHTLSAHSPRGGKLGYFSGGRGWGSPAGVFSVPSNRHTVIPHTVIPRQRTDKCQFLPQDRTVAPEPWTGYHAPTAKLDSVDCRTDRATSSDPLANG